MTRPSHSPTPQPWGAPGAPQPPYAQPQNGLGVAALVLGIVGVLFGILPFLFWLGAILGVLAVVFGIIGAGRAGKGLATNKGMAVTGAVLGGVALVASLAWLIVIATAVTDVAKEIEKETGAKGSASSSAAPGGEGAGESTAEPTEEPVDEVPEVLKFGDTFTYEDGIKVTVSQPRSHKPDGFAVGHAKGNRAFQVTITIVNGSKETLDVTAALPDASDAHGATAETVFDGDNATKPFNGKVLPGKQAKADYTFSLPAAAADELQIELSPTVLEHEPQLWTGPTK
ncbi:DUF4190 domain-containing protein [Streptomyces sp. NPDC126499]|uniref:DUF4190 domain-containing protein n=1 Tax=Streptomyces sp. NPDC126499 TaxID=3155314 RepID=UPI003318ABBB